ncbi:Nuclear pore complex protein, partial [Armadillidium nasatum]
MYTPKTGSSAQSNIMWSGGTHERSFTSASARAVAAAAARRRSAGVGFLSPGAKRSPFSGGGRSTPLNRSLQTSQIVESGSGQYNIESYGSSLPALVMEVLKFADRNAELSAVLAPSGWAWLVAGRRLLIWKYRLEGSKRIANHQFRELTLPPSDLAHRAQLVSVFSQGEGQVPSCVAVSPEGFVRFWPNISHEGSYYEISTDLQGQECDSLHFLGPSLGCLLATTTSTVIQIQPVSGSVSGNHINLHHLKPPAGILGDISRRVSSLVFGSMPTQAPEARLVGIAVIDSIDSYEKNIIILSARSLQKWYLCPGQPDKVVYECAVDKIIHEALVDYVWGRDRVGAQLQVWLVAIQNISGTNNIMILTAAVNPQ